MDTSSWRELDAGWRDRLVWLHDDYYFRRQEALWKANALRTLPVRHSRARVSIRYRLSMCALLQTAQVLTDDSRYPGEKPYMPNDARWSDVAAPIQTLAGCAIPRALCLS